MFQLTALGVLLVDTKTLSETGPHVVSQQRFGFATGHEAEERIGAVITKKIVFALDPSVTICPTLSAPLSPSLSLHHRPPRLAHVSRSLRQHFFVQN